MRCGLPVVERAMKMQEIVLRAISGTISWLQAADLLGLSHRTVRRWRARYERQGYDGLLDRQGRQPSARRVPLAEVERVLRLYRERATRGSMSGIFMRSHSGSTASRSRTAMCGRRSKARDWSRSVGPGVAIGCAGSRGRVAARCCILMAVPTPGWRWSPTRTRP